MFENKIESFLSSYQFLREKTIEEGAKIFVDFYHHDLSGEPTYTVSSYPDNVKLEYIKAYGFLIIIFTEETTLTFSTKNYNTNLSDETVVFSSVHDSETYYLINFG